VHHDNGVIGASTIARADARRVELLKAAGFNAIRSAHNPMSAAMVDACDRLGMLVMDETFDMWTETKSDDDYALRFEQWWEADVEAMVRRDRNHPSVILYSVGNEITDGSTPTGVQVGRALAEKVRALDDTRLVTQAVSGLLVGGPDLIAEMRETITASGVDEETGVNTVITNLGDMMAQMTRSPVVSAKTSEAYSYLDVAGYNYMEPRFDLDGELFPNRIIAATETHPSRIDLCWAGVVDHPHVIGDFTWTGWDYLGEAGVGRVDYDDVPDRVAGFLGGWPWLTAWCGDIDITGHRRPQSYYREIVWGRRIDPYVVVQSPDRHGSTIGYSSPWSWSDVIASWSWPGSVLDGRSLGRASAGAKHGYRAAFETTYQPGTLEAVAWRGGEEIGRCVLRSAEGPVLLAVNAERAEIDADPSDLAYVEVAFVDAQGSVCNTADRRVTVTVDGPGVLQGLGSANPVTEEPFTGNSCTTFQGRALAVVRPTGTGAIAVTATAEGCDPQTVRIDARARTAG
jgi:beta-galactosidase